MSEMSQIPQETRNTICLLNVEQVARILQQSPRTVRAWARSRRIPQPVKPGRRVMWQASVIKAWIDAGCPENFQS